MTLSPKVQSLVDLLIQELGLQATNPSAIRIVLDDHRMVQLVVPEISFRVQKGLDRRADPRA